MDGIYKSIEEYNPNKTLIVFVDMLMICLVTKTLIHQYTNYLLEVEK